MTGLAVRLGHRTSTCSRQQAEKCFSELVLPHAYRPKPDLTKRVRSAVQVSCPHAGWKPAVQFRAVTPAPPAPCRRRG